MKPRDLSLGTIRHLLELGSPLLNDLIFEAIKNGQIKVTAEMIRAVKDPVEKRKLLEAICLRQAGA